LSIDLLQGLRCAESNEKYRVVQKGPDQWDGGPRIGSELTQRENNDEAFGLT
jgi:hypothetical protein